MFTSEVQFGHAGSCANSDRETATAKNRSLREAGAYVPDSFDTLGELIASVYNELVAVIAYFYILNNYCVACIISICFLDK